MPLDLKDRVEHRCVDQDKGVGDISGDPNVLRGILAEQERQVTDGLVQGLDVRVCQPGIEQQDGGDTGMIGQTVQQTHSCTPSVISLVVWMRPNEGL